MSSTQVIFKPAGVIALLVIAGAIITTGIIGLRARNASNAEKSVPTKVVGATPNPTPSPKYIVESTMTPGEIAEKDLLLSLNASTEQARDWLFLGPISSGRAISNVSTNKDDEAKMRLIVGHTYLPTEAKYQAKENAPVTLDKTTYRWKKVRGSGFDFRQMFATPQTPPSMLVNMVVYGYTTIESKGATKKKLHFRSDDGAIIWINGQRVYMVDKIRGVTSEDVIPIDLRPGRNNVLVKVGQGSAGWGMAFQLEDVPTE